MGKVTVYDVASLAGVSATSVSNYFHNPGKLSEPTRLRIGDAVTNLGFVPDDGARYLRTGVRPIIGYISFELAAAHTPVIARAIERTVADRNMHLLLANDDGSVQRESSYLELFERQRVSGLIVAMLGDIEAELAALRRRGIPSVAIGAPAQNPRQPCVFTDDVEGGRLAVEHLIGLGRRRIGFVAGPLDVRQVQDRMSGAVKAVQSASGVALELIPAPERSVLAGVDAARALAARPASDRPDALFCVNDLLAIGMVQGLGDADIGVPDQIAVVGYDDIEFASSTRVPLTSVRTPDHDLGTAAAELLFDEIAHRHQDSLDRDAARIVFAPRLVVRRSTAG